MATGEQQLRVLTLEDASGSPALAGQLQRNGDKIEYRRTAGARELPFWAAAPSANRMLYLDANGEIAQAAAATDGQILIGSTGTAPVLATITQGSGVTITNGAGSITISSSGGAPKWNAITNPDGNLALTMGAYTTSFSWSDSGSAIFKPWVMTAALSQTGAGGYTMLEMNTSGTAGSGEQLFFDFRNAGATRMKGWVDDGGGSPGIELFAPAGTSCYIGLTNASYAGSVYLYFYDGGIGELNSTGQLDVTASGGTAKLRLGGTPTELGVGNGKRIVVQGEASSSQSGEKTLVLFDLDYTSEWVGALPTQRSIYVKAATLSETTPATVIATAAVMAFSGPHKGGTNVTITDSTAILVETRALANTTNGYGLIINAPTGATNNYAAKFAGTIVVNNGIKLLESAGATYYTTIQAGDQSANITYTLPTAAAGGNGYVLASTTGGVLSWSSTATPSAHNVLSASHGDTLTGTVVRGDLIVGNSTPKWARLAIGSGILSSNGTDPAWSGAMTNGQLLIGSTGAAPAVASLTAGSNITITPGAGSISIAVTSGVYALLASANTFTTGTQTIQTGADGTIGLAVKRNSGSQSANLQEWQDQNGTALAVVSPAGAIGVATASITSGFKADINGAARINGALRVEPASAPGSPANGDAWTDSTQKSLFTYQSGIKESLVGCVFTQTATQTIANTTTETTMFSTGIGTLTLPANFFTVGKKVRMRLTGYFSSTANPTMTIRVKFAGTTLMSGAASAGVVTDGSWCIEVEMICYTAGGSGTAWVQGRAFFSDGSGACKILEMVNSAADTIDTTASGALDVTGQWGTAHASNTCTTTNAMVEVLN